MKKKYKWDAENGIATCTLEDKENHIFTGVAVCASEDLDMLSEKTGLTIAESRAWIVYLKHIRDNELKPQIKMLWHLYHTMETSQHFSKKHYEAIMLFRKIDQLEQELQLTKYSIKELQEQLRLYIMNKENFYTMIRQKRQKLDKDKNF